MSESSEVPGRAATAGFAAVPFFGRQPARQLFAVLCLAFVLTAVAHRGFHEFVQTTLNGLTSGAYFALGAVGLTFVYGSLRLVNFAHGDFLTFGAYIAFLANVTLHLPLVLAVLLAMATTATLGALTEVLMWRPMRARGAGTFQLILMAVGLAYVLRYAIQFVAGPGFRSLRVNATTSFRLPWGLNFGRTALVVVIVSYCVLLAVGAMLRFTGLGKQMRALSDDLTLAETSGINTELVIVVIWLFAGGLAGLAGVLYACSVGSFDPTFGFVLILTLFAAVVLGGIGSPYGALAGGVTLGLVQEWSTLLFGPQWKIIVGFAVLMIVLIIRPEGVLGRPRSL